MSLVTRINDLTLGRKETWTPWRWPKDGRHKIMYRKSSGDRIQKRWYNSEYHRTSTSRQDDEADAEFLAGRFWEG